MADQVLKITVIDKNNSISKLSTIVDMLYPGRLDGKPPYLSKIDWAQKCEAKLLKEKWKNAYIQYNAIENLKTLDTTIDVEG